MSAPGSRLWIAAIGALLVCAGCGFKGPLYLPERNATVVTHPAAQGAQAAPIPGPAPTPAKKKKRETSPAAQPPGASAAPPR